MCAVHLVCFKCFLINKLYANYFKIQFLLTCSPILKRSYDRFNRKCVLILSYDITSNFLNSYVLLVTVLRQNFE